MQCENIYKVQNPSRDKHSEMLARMLPLLSQLIYSLLGTLTKIIGRPELEIRQLVSKSQFLRITWYPTARNHHVKKRPSMTRVLSG